MVRVNQHPTDATLIAALSAGDSSTRLRAALAAGTDARATLLEVLVERCADEPDFFVRDMLTWALTRLPVAETVPRLVAELDAAQAQARSQALHTLSKIGDPQPYPEILRFLRDPDDETARTAWRAAQALSPESEKPALATQLATQLGRGEHDLQRSLSRALVALGDAAEPALRDAAASGEEGVRLHAEATRRLADDPDLGFAAALDEATKASILGS
ncbi:HEAT repeat domain-containing protein [Barrientosiimonas endolithica]|uniref:HEAT repeat domain-containing protein n=1 Tax=Barrientosiimonas endolithica TaxID=1535208 RepID=A0ABM8HC39_9MICO|nr:hypothetical protein GCM10025872_21600 [Barrientosiimonas endolithica]